MQACGGMPTVGMMQGGAPWRLSSKVWAGSLSTLRGLIGSVARAEILFASHGCDRLASGAVTLEASPRREGTGDVVTGE